MKPRILIVGWGRSGKDEAGAFFHQHCGLSYAGSTSWAALPLMAKFLDLPEQLAWEQRHEHRQFWKDTCDKFRADDPLLLIKRALESGRQCVTGIRDKVEIDAAKAAGIFKHILWIDRPGIPPDFTVTFTEADCTDYVRNDGSLRRFHRNLVVWALSVGITDVYPEDLLADLDP